jgi:hypothetical protein
MISQPQVYLYGDHALSGPSKFNTLRAALLLGLAALPDPEAWYRIEDLSDAINYQLDLGPIDELEI